MLPPSITDFDIIDDQPAYPVEQLACRVKEPYFDLPEPLNLYDISPACAMAPPPSLYITVINNGHTYNTTIYRHDTASYLVEQVRNLSPDLPKVDLQLLARSVTSGTNTSLSLFSHSIIFCRGFQASSG